MNNKYFKSLALITLLLISGIAYAQDDDRINITNNLYGAVSFGQSEFDIDFGNVNVKKEDNKDSSLGLSFGYLLNENFGLEFGYQQLGEGEVTTAGINASDPDIVTTYEATGWTLGGSVTMPVSDRFVIGGRVGFLLWDVDVEQTWGNASVTNSSDGSDVYWGLTFGYKIGDNATIGMGYSGYSVGDVEDAADDEYDVDITGLNAYFSFRF